MRCKRCAKDRGSASACAAPAGCCEAGCVFEESRQRVCVHHRASSSCAWVKAPGAAQRAAARASHSPADAAIPRPAQAYRVGDWARARTELEACRGARTDVAGRPLVDGPSDVLLRYMADTGFAAPSDWAGFRELTEK